MNDTRRPIAADCSRPSEPQTPRLAPACRDDVSTRESGSRRKVFTCGGCPVRWTLHRRAHCSGCHLTFTGVTAFDQHRVHGACAAPGAVGLVERDGGMWGAPPMPAEVAAKLRAAGGAR